MLQSWKALLVASILIYSFIGIRTFQVSNQIAEKTAQFDQNGNGFFDNEEITDEVKAFNRWYASHAPSTSNYIYGIPFAVAISVFLFFLRYTLLRLVGIFQYGMGSR